MEIAYSHWQLCKHFNQKINQKPEYCIKCWEESTPHTRTHTLLCVRREGYEICCHRYPAHQGGQSTAGDARATRADLHSPAPLTLLLAPRQLLYGSAAEREHRETVSADQSLSFTHWILNISHPLSLSHSLSLSFSRLPVDGFLEASPCLLTWTPRHPSANNSGKRLSLGAVSGAVDDAVAFTNGLVETGRPLSLLSRVAMP